MRMLYCSNTSISILATNNMLDLEILNVIGTHISSISVVDLPKMKKVFGCDMENRTILTGPGVERCSM